MDNHSARFLKGCERLTRACGHLVGLVCTMESSCIRHTELPDTTALFADFLYQFERVARFYPHDPGNPQSFGRVAAHLNYPAERRARLIRVLSAQNGESESLARLARPETVVVVTGQQTGLLSGPAYTIYKALSAVRLAHRLSEQGIPAAPVFWLATEDHDYAEVNHCWLLDATGKPRRIEGADAAGQRRPTGAIPAPEDLVSRLEEALRGLPFAEEVLELVAAAYPKGATLGSGFAALLRRLLDRWGLLCFDPLAPEARQLLAPKLQQAAEAGAELAEAVIERSRELVSAGYHAQVRVAPEASLLFLLEGGQRLAIRREGAEYVCAGRRLTRRELADRAADLSPSALLRPVLQDWALPVVASVVGPSELAYLAQAAPLYRILGVQPPVWVPRASMTLLDARAARLMHRYGLRLQDFFQGEQFLRERIAQRLTPPELEILMRAAGADVAAALERLGRGLTEFDATLGRAFEKSRRKIFYQLAKIERKAAREALRRHERAGSDAAWLSAFVYPHRRLQERFYSTLAFLARYGSDLLSRIYERISSECLDHQVAVI